MKVINVCLLIFQLVAVPSQGQCSCGGTTASTMNSTNMTAMTTMAPTTMAPTVVETTETPGEGTGGGGGNSDGNGTSAVAPTDAPTDAPTNGGNGSSAGNGTSANAPTSPPPTPSSGPSYTQFSPTTAATTPSSGPSTTAAATTAAPPTTTVAQRLLQETNISDDNATSAATTTMATMAAATTTTAECVCPPEVMTTFTSTMTFGDPSELADIDFRAVVASAAAEQSWDTSMVEAVATIKVAVAYTFPEGTSITTTQCESAVATAYNVNEDMVLCVEGAAGAAATDAASDATTTANATTTAAAARRLSDVVMDVQLSFAEDNAAGAIAASTASSNLTALTAALANLPEPVVTVEPTVSEPVVTVDIEFTVTSDMAVEPPTTDSMVGFFTLQGATVTVMNSEPTVGYSFMPCSVSDTVCGSGFQLRDNAETIGCAGEECTAAADSATCCTSAPATAGARGTCVLSSLTVLALSCNFHFF